MSDFLEFFFDLDNPGYFYRLGPASLAADHKEHQHKNAYENPFSDHHDLFLPYTIQKGDVKIIPVASHPFKQDSTRQA